MSDQKPPTISEAVDVLLDVMKSTTDPIPDALKILFAGCGHAETRDILYAFLGEPSRLGRSMNDPEPPAIGDGVPVWDLVLDDMKKRDAVGEAQYGTRLRTHNGRRPLVDLYQELLDAVVYVRQEIEERKDATVYIVLVDGDICSVKATEREAAEVIHQLARDLEVDFQKHGNYRVERWVIGEETDDRKTAP